MAVKEISYHFVHWELNFSQKSFYLAYINSNKRQLFVRGPDHLGITPLTQKQVKNPKKFAIMDHTFLEGHNTTYNDFSILIPENNQFKLHLKESLLIKK